MIDQINIVTVDVQFKLSEMEKETKKLEQGTVEYRIQTNMHGMLIKNFLNLLNRYQEIEIKHKKKQKERMERQLFIGKERLEKQILK